MKISPMAGDSKIRILIAHGQFAIRQRLGAILEGRTFSVAGEAGTGEEAVRLASELSPDVAVLHQVLPLINGLDAAFEIRRGSPVVRVILLGRRQDRGYVAEALRAGVSGYVLESRALSDLVGAVQAIARGEAYFSPGVAPGAPTDSPREGGPPADPLTHRERQVLQLIAEGKTTPEIAGLLRVSVRTAETHRYRLMTKLGIHQVAGLVRYAVRRGLIEP